MGKRIIIIRRITYNDFIRFSSYVHHTVIDSVQTVGLCTIVEGSGVSGRGGGEAVGGQ